MDFKRCEYCQEERRPHVHLVIPTRQGDVASRALLSVAAGLEVVRCLESPGDLMTYGVISHEAGRLLTIGASQVDTLNLSIGQQNLPETGGGFDRNEFFRDLARKLADILRPLQPQSPLPKGYPFTRRVETAGRRVPR